MITTKKKPVVITQKNMIKKSRHQNTKKDRGIRNKKQCVYK